MAKLPYTFTICPRDLTINQAEHIWPAACKGATTINNHEEKK